MALKNFNRIANFFSNSITIKAEDLDNQFNSLAKYFNEEIIPLLTNFNNAKLPGSINPGNFNKFLVNVGDGTLKYTNLSEDSFENSSIRLNNLELKVPCSILWYNAKTKSVEVASPSEETQVLQMKDGVVFWGKLDGEIFNDGVLTGDMIEENSLTIENLPNKGALYFEENSLTIEKFKDIPKNQFGEFILPDKIADKTITEDNFTPEALEDFKNNTYNNMIPDDHIDSFFIDLRKPINSAIFTTRLLKKETMPAGLFSFSRAVSSLLTLGFRGQRGLATDQLYIPVRLTPLIFKDNSINAERLHSCVEFSDGRTTLYPAHEYLLQDNVIGPEHLSPGIRKKLGFEYE